MIQNPTFFIGVVEDIHDPAEKNRVKVRIYGKHTEDTTLVPVDSLPWTSVVMPVTSGGSLPSAASSHSLLQGSWVFGMYLDQNQQEALVLGSLPSSSTVREKEDKSGFQDPDHVHPKRSDIDTPHAATNDFTRSFSYQNRLNQRLQDIPVASQPELSTLDTQPAEEPITFSLLNPVDTQKTVYPHSHVYQTEAGHVFEVDNTAGYERIVDTHSSGTYSEVIADGTTTHVVTGDGYQVIAGKNNVYIVGNCNMTVGGDLRTLVRGNYHLEVEGDKTENIHGNTRTKIGKSSLTEILGNTGTNISGDVKLKIHGQRTEESVGDTNMLFDANLDITTVGDRTESTLSRHLILSTKNMKINCGQKIHINTRVARFSGDVIAGGGGISLITHLHSQNNGNDSGGGAVVSKPFGAGVGS